MTRGIYTKWIIGAVFILLIVATGCILYYQHTTAADRHAAAQADKLLETWKADKAKPPTPAETESTKPTAENRTLTAEKPVNKVTAAMKNDFAAETEQTSTPVDTDEDRISAFGFGPYPELPADFPFQDMFDPPYYSRSPDDPYKDDPDYELMDRLWVELWKRGEKVEGFGTLDSTGLFYPTIRGRIYVEWAPRWKVFGKGFGRTISYIDYHPDDRDRLLHINRESEIPSDFEVFDISEGINPYTFLNLPEK